MKLKAVVLQYFRGYNESTRIDLESLTAFVGRNDVGKSTILEALEIFFNNEVVKISADDRCVYTSDQQIRIGCVFSGYPEELVIDSSAKTTLKSEFLLNADADLEIHKIFDCSVKNIKESVFALADHPSSANISELLLKKKDDLKALITELKIDPKGIDLRSNVQMRQAIRRVVGTTDRKLTEVPLDKEDAKKIWEQLKLHLPMYALFRSDRSSQDGDGEVQNPLKFAVLEAIKSLDQEIQHIEDIVRTKTQDVAKRTLEKLREMDTSLAEELKTDFKSDRKWESLFKIGLDSDDGIPINKRGSGVRRLILLNFFRAEAERRQTEENAPGVIYAIEEPETSQHPSNQRLLIEAFMNLAEQSDTQVLLTTHTPGLAGLIPSNSLRYVHRGLDKKVIVEHGHEGVYSRIANELGVSPDKRVQVLFCVEGKNDVAFMRHIGQLLGSDDNSLVSIADDPRVAIMPLGGTSLKDWVQERYLKGLGLKEVHIYDKGPDKSPKFSEACKSVNQRKDGSWGVLTGKREIENYLHPVAIDDALGVKIAFGPEDNVPLIAAKAVHEADSSSKPWVELTEEEIKSKERRVKIRLNNDAARKMTIALLNESDPNSDILGWIKRIGLMLS